MEIKVWVNQIFKIGYEYIKNNSYINLVDENHIRIFLSCSNAEKHTMSHIFH